MRSNLHRMLLQLPGAQSLIFELDRIEICRQRSLRIHYQSPAVRQHHNHVGTQATVLGIQSLLHAKIAVIHHPGHFDRPTELHFAPLTACMRSPQSLYQIGCLRPERLQLRRQHRVSRHASSFQLMNFASTFVNDSLRGRTSSSMAICRFANAVSARSRNIWLLACSACADKA